VKESPVVVALLTVEYRLHGNDSLKGKRRVANSLKQKVRNTFNVSIAEIGSEDFLGRLRLVAAAVGNSEERLREKMDRCVSMMETVCAEEMIYSSLEFLAGD
jgi:uncharacterized protein YlxP (DUF503 family)